MHESSPTCHFLSASYMGKFWEILTYIGGGDICFWGGDICSNDSIVCKIRFGLFWFYQHNKLKANYHTKESKTLNLSTEQTCPNLHWCLNAVTAAMLAFVC